MRPSHPNAVELGGYIWTQMNSKAGAQLNNTPAPSFSGYPIRQRFRSCLRDAFEALAVPAQIGVAIIAPIDCEPVSIPPLGEELVSDRHSAKAIFQGFFGFFRRHSRMCFRGRLSTCGLSDARLYFPRCELIPARKRRRQGVARLAGYRG